MLGVVAAQAGFASAGERSAPVAKEAKKCKKKHRRKCHRRAARTYDLDYYAAIAAMKGELIRIGTIDAEQSGAAVYYMLDTSSCGWSVAYTGGHSLGCYGYTYEEDSTCNYFGYDWNRQKYSLIARLVSVYSPQVTVGSTWLSNGFHCADLGSTGSP